jgi:hypothetical protein
MNHGKKTCSKDIHISWATTKIIFITDEGTHIVIIREREEINW